MSKALSRRDFLRLTGMGIASAGLLQACVAPQGAAPAGAPAAEGKRYTFVWSPKATNNPVFDVARAGGQLRAEELGDVDFQWVGPSEADAEKQVQLLDDW